MKYVKILINLGTWHLKPYWFRKPVCGWDVEEGGILCFKLVIMRELVKDDK